MFLGFECWELFNVSSSGWIKKDQAVDVHFSAQSSVAVLPEDVSVNKFVTFKHGNILQYESQNCA